MSDLLCVVCLKEQAMGSDDEPSYAITIVDGDALCGDHFLQALRGKTFNPVPEKP